jgi:hypothetical protein
MPAQPVVGHCAGIFCARKGKISAETGSLCAAELHFGYYVGAVNDRPYIFHKTFSAFCNTPADPLTGVV